MSADIQARLLALADRVNEAASGGLVHPLVLFRFEADMRALAARLPSAEAVPVAWCALTSDGEKIAYRDGGLALLTGRYGDEAHPVPLYAAPPSPLADPRVRELMRVSAKAAKHVRPTCSELYAELAAALRTLDQSAGGEP